MTRIVGFCANLERVKAEAISSSETEIASLRSKYEKKQKEYNQLKESTSADVSLFLFEWALI